MGICLTFTLVWRQIPLDYCWETWLKHLLTVDLGETGDRACDLQNVWLDLLRSQRVRRKLTGQANRLMSPLLCMSLIIYLVLCMKTKQSIWTFGPLSQCWSLLYIHYLCSNLPRMRHYASSSVGWLLTSIAAAAVYSVLISPYKAAALSLVPS